MSNGIVVSRGWSSDYAKRKFGIELDTADLIKILTEAGFPEPVEAVADKMTIGDVYLVLDAQAMMFIHHSLSVFEPEQARAHLQRMLKAQQDRNGVLALYPGYAAAKAGTEAPE